MFQPSQGRNLTTALTAMGCAEMAGHAAQHLVVAHWPMPIRPSQTSEHDLKSRVGQVCRSGKRLSLKSDRGYKIGSRLSWQCSETSRLLKHQPRHGRLSLDRRYSRYS